MTPAEIAKEWRRLRELWWQAADAGKNIGAFDAVLVGFLADHETEILDVLERKDEK